MEQRTRAELDMVLHAQPLAPGHRIVWRGADSVRLQSASQMLDSALLLTLAQQQVRQVFAAPGLTLELRLAAPLAELVAPPGALQYQARLADATRLHARMAVWIDVLAQDAVYRSVLVPLAVQAWREAYVARRALPAGALLAPADVELRREDVAGLAEAALAPGALASGGRLRQALEAGQIVTTRQVAGGDMVLRGDRVRLVSHGAGIAVETSAMAQADAVVGQQVRVKPDRSNETVQAWVIAPGLVSMEGR
jgi:flagella basal body P-ring formation protein FlgA